MNFTIPRFQSKVAALAVFQTHLGHAPIDWPTWVELGSLKWTEDVVCFVG